MRNILAISLAAILTGCAGMSPSSTANIQAGAAELNTVAVGVVGSAPESAFRAVVSAEGGQFQSLRLPYSHVPALQICCITAGAITVTGDHGAFTLESVGDTVLILSPAGGPSAGRGGLAFEFCDGTGEISITAAGR